MDFIDNSTEQHHDARYSRVWLSDELVVAADWVETPYLFCTELTDRVAPGMSEAKLVWHCGDFPSFYGTANKKQKPLGLERVYVKIEVLTPYAVPPGEKPPAIEPDPTVEYTWFGTIESDEFTELLSKKNPPATDQIFTVYGLMRDLENTIVTTSVLVNAAGDDVIRIPRGLTFNPETAVDQPGLGNQYRSTLDVDAGVSWVFQNERWDGTAGEEPERWDAYTAVDHLLTHQSPKKTIDGITKTCLWKFAGLDDVLGPNHPLNTIQWYDIANIPTDRRSLKDIIDELIDRNRFVGWYVYGDDSGAEFTAYLKVFSFSDKEIELVERGHKIAENTDQVLLDLLDKPEVVDLEVTNNGTQRYDEIVVEGELITSTLTLRYYASDATNGGFTEDWTAAEEYAYIIGASGESGYEELEEEEKVSRNMAIRSDESISHVFSRFKMNDDFHSTGTSFAAGDYKVTLDDEALSILTADNVFTITNSSVYSTDLWWSRGSRFLRYLPQSERDNSAITDTRIDPFIIFNTSTSPSQFQYGDQLNADQQRMFSVGIEPLEDELGFRAVVGLAGAQQMIASDNWINATDLDDVTIAPAETPPSIDPDNSEYKPLDYKTQMIPTLALQWDRRVNYTESLSPPNFTAAKRRKFIRVNDARLDIRLPLTVIGVNADGSANIDTTGSLIRDDRTRLEEIGKAAAKWYGTYRQAMNCTIGKLTLKIRPPVVPAEGEPQNGTNETPVSLGTLVTKVGVLISKPDINSPITSIGFNLERQQTNIQTTFYDGDFV